MPSVEQKLILRLVKEKGLTIAGLGLRFDRVVMGLMEGLHAFAAQAVPPGTLVLVTVTAPIRLPAKTSAAMKAKIESLLARPRSRRDTKVTIHENGVRIRLLNDAHPLAPRLLGFVHNRSSDSADLLNLIETGLGRSQPD